MHLQPAAVEGPPSPTFGRSPLTCGQGEFGSDDTPCPLGEWVRFALPAARRLNLR